MRYYCPNCWADFWEQNPSVCPKCHYDIARYDQRDYVEKLLTALHHRVGEIPYWAMMVLAARKERRALPHLQELRRTTKDPALARAAAAAIQQIEGSAGCA